MRIPRLRISIAAMLAVAGVTAAVAVAAPTRSSGASPIEQAATKSGKASSFKFDFTVSISGGGSSIPGGKISLSGSGAANTAHKAATVKLDLSTLAPLLGAATQGATIPKTIELVVIDNVVYLNFPALAKQAGAPGKTWVRFDLTKLPKSKTGGVDPKAVGNVSPQQALTALRSALKVHKVGSDSYGTHYHATLHLSALVGLLPKAQQATSSASLAKAGITSFPLDVWVGKAGYVTRFVTSISVKAQKGTPAVSVAFTLNIHDYNHKVHVSAPPASKTADGNKLLTGLLAGLPGG
jgi:hypothetical protein